MVSRPVTGQFVAPAEAAVLLTRLAPPARTARVLRRSRVETALAGALEYPLTLIIAPLGSGKTVALAALALHGGWPAAWCRAVATETPQQLLAHLVAAFRPLVRLDEAAILAACNDNADLRPALELFANQLSVALDDETLLVIDDYHLLDALPELSAVIEHLIAVQPLRLHIVLAGRCEPTLPGLTAARLRGDLLELGPRDLAFTPPEVTALAEQIGRPPPADRDALNSATHGWALGIQIALNAADWRNALGLGDTPAPDLDAYLADELLATLPADLRTFLIRTAGMRFLDPAACALVVTADPAPLLAEVRRRRLFIEADARGRLHYQPVVQAFLTRQAIASLSDWEAIHRALAAYYRRSGDQEGALHHLITIAAPEAAAALAELAPALVAAGQPEAALAWLDRLTSSARNDPQLLLVQANAYRQLGRFEAALAAFERAADGFAAQHDAEGQVRALRGQAEVYLDTVHPEPATALLKRAIRLLPPTQTAERAALIRLQAENWANRGRADVAILLQRAADRLEVKHWGQEPGRLPKPPVAGSQAPLPPRLLLRAGRLNEARQQLEAILWAESQNSGSLISRTGAHREPVLLLSLIYALLGNGSRALAMAGRGMLEAQQIGARLTEAIAEMRAGHAYQIIAPNDPSLALARYTAATQTIRQFGVPRTRAEVYLGLTLLHGHDGDLLRAEADAREGLQIVSAAGDDWTAGLILLALGSVAVAADDPHGVTWLAEARQRFARGRDQFGLTLVNLWLALHALHHGQTDQLDRLLHDLFSAVATYGYEDLLIAPSLFGPRDMATIVPLLLRGRHLPAHAELAGRLLRQGFPTIAADDTVDDYYPGFTLRVQMLGSFHVWRGAQEIQAREWQREKARQLFQLLLTQRGHWIQREQICAWLWPEADLEAAERQFKVTLNALNAALEPARPPRIAPFFIRRQGLAYSFAPSYGVWIDVDEFELRVAAAAADGEPDFARHNAQIAVQLYKGDFLAEALYDPWTIEERERLLARYLATAVSYAARLSDAGDHAGAIHLCEQILRRDRGYEEAYQVLMRAHARSGSRSQALRSYARCVQALHDELGMEPLPETEALHQRLKRNEPI
jgi:DNA-binding SARP family transcriptional activator